MMRYKKKLLSNSTWFKKKRSKEEQATNTAKKSGARVRNKEQLLDDELQVRSVLEQDKGGTREHGLQPWVQNQGCGAGPL